MALSGTITKAIGSGYKLLIEWSATQSIANNTSTITAKLYLQSLSSYYYINSSAPRQAKVTISGDLISPIPTPSAQLSANQKKLLATHVYTTGHNSDGTKTLAISGSFDMSGITLSGTDYGTVSLSQTVTLNTIPRKSTLTSSTDWKAPRAFPISVQRASSSFTHNAKIYVKRKSSSTWTIVKTFMNFETYVGGGFSVDEMKIVFQTLATDSSGDLRIYLETYNGDTLIGSMDYKEDDNTNGLMKGEVVVEYSSKLDANSTATFNVGDTKSVGIARNHWDYTHKVEFVVNGVSIHTSPTIEYSYDWIPTQSEKDSMYTTMKSLAKANTSINITTYYNGIQVDKVKSSTGTATVVNSNPTFGTGYTYKDSNATTVAITGTDTYIIQNASTVQVTLPTSANATGVNKADIVKYTATLNGVSVTQNYSSTTALTFDFGKVNSSSNVTLSVKAIDTRGYSTTTTKTITMLPYSTPSVSAIAKRANGFEANTDVDVSGTISPVTIGGLNKNAVTKVEYRYREDIATSTFPTAWTTFVYTTLNNTYSADLQTIVLDQTKGYVFEFRTTDKLGNTVVTKSVAVGVPIMFIDSDKKSLGVGMFPTTTGGFDVKGNISARNPNNISAEAYLGWKSDIARIRIGGTGTGSVNGFQIQGTGDTPMLSLKNGQTLSVVDSKTLTLNGVDLQRGLEVPRTTPSMTNSWTAYFNTAYLKTYDGWVMLIGMAQNSGFTQTSPDAPMFTLPVGCRPTTNTQIFYCGTRGGGSIRVDVMTTGEVIPKGASAESNSYVQWINLNGVVFYAG